MDDVRFKSERNMYDTFDCRTANTIKHTRYQVGTDYYATATVNTINISISYSYYHTTTIITTIGYFKILLIPGIRTGGGEDRHL